MLHRFSWYLKSVEDQSKAEISSDYPYSRDCAELHPRWCVEHRTATFLLKRSAICLHLIKGQNCTVSKDSQSWDSSLIKDHLSPNCFLVQQTHSYQSSHNLQTFSPSEGECCPTSLYCVSDSCRSAWCHLHGACIRCCTPSHNFCPSNQRFMFVTTDLHAYC